MMNAKLFIISIFLLSVSFEIYAQGQPPSFYIDKGACPGESCVYGAWKTEKTITAYASPDRKSKIVGKFKAGSKILALTGEVHSIPGRFLVTKRHGEYKRGDVLWLYTYLGEGYVKTWFNRKWGQEEIIIPIPGHSDRCQDCWGDLTQKGKSTWWAKIKSADGWTGWTNLAGENFSGQYDP